MSSSETESSHHSDHDRSTRSGHIQPSDHNSHSRSSSHSRSGSSRKHHHQSRSKSRVAHVDSLAKNLAQENQKLKRKIDALQLENASNSKKSRRQGAEKSIENQGQALGRIATLYTPIASLVRIFFADETDAKEEDPVDLDEKELEEYFVHQMEKRKTQRDIRAYHIVAGTVPGFQKAVDLAGTDVGAILSLCKQLQTGSISARSDDVHTLMIELANWFNFRPIPFRADPLLLNHSRELRGFKHDLTGKADDVMLMLQIKDEEGNPTDVEDGFLHGTLLIQTWHQIFRASGSISDDEISSSHKVSNTPAPVPQSNKARTSTKQSLAELYGLKKVTPQTIAYCCVLLRFSLSNAKKWGQDRSFNYEGLYNEMIDYFEAADPEDEEVQKHLAELLQWWNEQAFAEEDASGSLKPSFHFQSTLEEQRSAKASITAAAPTASNDANAPTASAPP
ncbi:uncharacterized protein C8R40DRAFT_1178152 [Lentinula edodes]|uniref:uncharacterized protein n=1 Tax=Lentinula edodes TaxID=5353 RepID=UPI001E8E7608|nr:uncharacterized protein C8R40DRAFT_1178152 [Lentinula edodes]KAH7868124.1 hypothetical protein C8R40DRAFT_1178152 [Lentinula edodes]